MNILAQISSDTQFTLTLGAACLIAGSVVTSVWRAANHLRDVKDELKGLKIAVLQCWTKHDQERWTYRLQIKNPALEVPQVNADSQHGSDEKQE